jgi:hypothetical protein
VAVIVMLYALSIGPAMMLVDKKMLPQTTSTARVLEIVYRPLSWACELIYLEKPLVMYLHLWVPSQFDSKGKSK